MNKHLIILILVAIILHSCHSENDSTKKDSTATPQVLKDVQLSIDAVLKEMQDSLKSGTIELSHTRIDEDIIREILKSYLDTFPCLFDCCYVDTNGIMWYVEPPEYRAHEGSDISNQKHIRSILNDHQPIASHLFFAVEGFWAVDLEYPIFVSNEYAGSLSMLIEPKKFLEKIISPLVKGIPVEFWIMEETGRIIYDPDNSEIGKVIFTDDIYKDYPEIIELANNALAEESGSQIYEFYETGMGRLIKKQAYWVTIQLMGVEWKLFMTHPNNYVHDIGEEDIKKMNDDLKTIANDKTFINNIAAYNKDEIMNTMVNFYLEYPNIYSVAWVDSDITVRCGMPLGNSLKNYQFTREKDVSSITFIELVENGEEATFEMELIEGSVGRFNLYPIKNSDEYHGMLYYIYLIE